MGYLVIGFCTCSADGDVEKVIEECISLCDKLKDGNYDENIRHLKYKLANLSKLATEQLNEKSSTIDMLLADLKETSQTNDTLLEDLKRLQSLLVQLERVKDTTVVKKEPFSPSIVYKHLEHQTSMSMMMSLFALLLVCIYACTQYSCYLSVSGQTRT